MKYPNILIIIFLFVSVKSSFCQKLTKTERAYFILGTLSDYMGREHQPETENYLDGYDLSEAPLELAIDSLLKIDYPLSSYTIKKYVNTEYNLYSASITSTSLAQKFNSYYNFDQSKSNLEGGVLKANVFANDGERLAFLAGAYVRFGLPNDTPYEILIGNSASKARVCYELLMYFKCSPYYEIIKDNIPVPHIIYFHPTHQIQTYLQQFLYLRKRLEAERNELVRRGMSRRKEQ